MPEFNDALKRLDSALTLLGDYEISNGGQTHKVADTYEFEIMRKEIGRVGNGWQRYRTALWNIKEDLKRFDFDA